MIPLHWVEVDTGEIHRKKLARAKFVEFFAQRQPARVVMEACGGARTLTAMGHAVELLPAGQVRDFVRGNKDDAADARAIWLAAGHDDIRRVPIKSTEQQAILSLHRTRSHWVSVRTATINSLRGLLYEFGIFLPQGRHTALRMLAEQRADIDTKLPASIVRLVTEQLRSLRELDTRCRGCRWPDPGRAAKRGGSQDPAPPPPHLSASVGAGKQGVPNGVGAFCSQPAL